MTEDVFREVCTATNRGESHGICDGFGSCQCAPPFIGSDCSTKVSRASLVFDTRNGRIQAMVFMVSRFGELCVCVRVCVYLLNAT